MYFHKNISLYKRFFFFNSLTHLFSKACCLHRGQSSRFTRRFARVQCLCSLPFTHQPFWCKARYGHCIFCLFLLRLFFALFFPPFSFPAAPSPPRCFHRAVGERGLRGGRADLALVLQKSWLLSGSEARWENLLVWYKTNDGGGEKKEGRKKKESAVAMENRPWQQEAGASANILL